jgi:hypothetical protein
MENWSLRLPYRRGDIESRERRGLDQDSGGEEERRGRKRERERRRK